MSCESLLIMPGKCCGNWAIMTLNLQGACKLMSQSIKGYGGLVLHMHATQLSGLLMHSWQQCVYKKKHIIQLYTNVVKNLVLNLP